MWSDLHSINNLTYISPVFAIIKNYQLIPWDSSTLKRGCPIRLSTDIAHVRTWDANTKDILRKVALASTIANLPIE